MYFLNFLPFANSAFHRLWGFFWQSYVGREEFYSIEYIQCKFLRLQDGLVF